MCKVMLILFVILGLTGPVQGLASGFTLSVQFMRQDDGMTCSELWYNDKVIWRLALLTDGAKPVSGSHTTATTLVAPDIINGMFLIKIQ